MHMQSSTICRTEKKTNKQTIGTENATRCAIRAEDIFWFLLFHKNTDMFASAAKATRCLWRDVDLRNSRNFQIAVIR